MITNYLINQIFFEPSLITSSAHASIRALFESKLESGQFSVREGTDVCGEAVEIPGMVVKDGVAEIPISGAIGINLHGFAKGRGAVDVNDVADEIDIAEADPSVKAVLFNIDSPGGMVTGTPELADKIKGMRKPTMTFSNGMIASAAYWVAAATGSIFTTKSAQVGSIGVYLPVFDESRAFERAGVRVELIKAGSLKGAGFPGVPLSEGQRAHLQQRVDDIYKMFKTHVLENRGNGIKDSQMQGQTFLAADAFKGFLIDGIVPSKADALRLLR